MRNFFRPVALAGVLVLATVQATAQNPSRPVRLIVPFVAGGPSDIVARPLGQMLGDALKAMVIIDNRPGAGGSMGSDVVAKSAPDGYTLLMGTAGTHAINPALYKKLPFDPVKDFTPIALVATAPLAIVVNPSQPVHDVAGLVALAKKIPGKISYGSAGNGTPHHLTGEMFKAAAGIDLQHVPYKGSPQALTDLIGGQIQMMFDPVQSAMAHIQTGKVRAIAVTGEQRSAALPNVPTVTESGFPGFETTQWWGVFAPANLPAAQAATLAAEIERIVRSGAFRDRLEPLGVLPTVLSLSAFGEFQRRELAKWGKAVRDSGATVD